MKRLGKRKFKRRLIRRKHRKGSFAKRVFKVMKRHAGLNYFDA